MTRGNARELAVHLIYSREFTGQEPEQEVASRLEKEYYKTLSQENQVYSDRPSASQVRYIDTVVTGVAISEAVRLAKMYDGEEAGAFTNGILGSFARSLPQEGA